MDVDKVVITNMGALKEKYGSKMARVDRALALLVAADRKRGVETRLVSVDSTASVTARARDSWERSLIHSLKKWLGTTRTAWSSTPRAGR